MLGGTDFRINGILVDDSEYGSITAVDLPSRSVLSGVFSDGTPFAFTSTDGDWFAPGTLQVSTLRYRRPRLGVRLPLTTPLPRGVKPGDKLVIEAGDNVGTNFTAGWESKLTVAGGEIGDNFEAVGAEVNLIDGVIGNDMDAMFGAEVNVTGGTIGYGLEAHGGSVINISGGIFPEVTARAGSEINITGGMLGQYSENEFYPGGSIGLEPGSALHVTGTDFWLGGEPVEGLEPGSSIVLELEAQIYPYISLVATLLDGSPFRGNFSRADRVWQPDALPDVPFTLTLTAALPGDFDDNQIVDSGDLELWQTQFGSGTIGTAIRNGSDFLSWQRSLGMEVNALANSQVPEPSSWQSIAIVLAIALLNVRQNRIFRCAARVE